jgi:nucleotide-binding universal stress UspA family protein
MADPDNAEAREAVIAALGPESCVVKGPAFAIDARLAEIWGGEARRRLNLVVCDFPIPLSEDLWDYSRALGSLLEAHLHRMTTEGELNALDREGRRVDCDLLVTGFRLGKRYHPLLRRLLSRSTADDDVTGQQSAIPCAILVAQRPRWPLERILLVICGESADNAAMDWTLRLAKPSTAAVTVLAAVPPVPIMYHGLSRMEQGVAALLTTDTALGRQMHLAARRLTECKVDGTLRVRQGVPDQQICREVVEGDYDLIVMATKPCRWWLRQLKGELSCSLLGRIDRPMLLAGLATAYRSGAE